MKYLKAFFVFLICAHLVSCTDAVTKKGEKVCKMYFQELLSDPTSLKIYNEEVVKNGDHDRIFKIDYGYKDKYGVMKRDYVEIKTDILTEVDCPKERTFFYVNGDLTTLDAVWKRRRTGELLDIINGN